jgi:hypothetical protein
MGLNPLQGHPAPPASLSFEYIQFQESALCFEPRTEKEEKCSQLVLQVWEKLTDCRDHGLQRSLTAEITDCRDH